MSWRLVATFAVLVLAPSVVFAEAGGVCSILTKLDQAALAFDDVEYTTNIEYRENSKLVKNYQIRVVTKGMHKALVSFLAPGDMVGTRVLIVDPETMYTYMPDPGRVRRVAGHSRRQQFMGTNMYYEDITERRYSERWRCRPGETTAETSTLTLRPNPGVKSAYSKMIVTINREREAVERIQYYEETRHIKSQIRESWKTMDGIDRASIIRFVSHDRNAELRLEYTLWRANTGVPDSAFTRRALLRGL